MGLNDTATGEDLISGGTVMMMMRSREVNLCMSALMNGVIICNFIYTETCWNVQSMKIVRVCLWRISGSD
jgi:hypothetical protein